MRWFVEFAAGCGLGLRVDGTVSQIVHTLVLHASLPFSNWNSRLEYLHLVLQGPICTTNEARAEVTGPTRSGCTVRIVCGA